MLNRIIIPILLILGGLGSIIIANWFTIGSILIFVGIGAGIWMHISSSARADQDRALIDAAAVLMFRGGAGNIYTECLFREVSHKRAGKNTLELLRKALSINPNDSDALSLLVSFLFSENIASKHAVELLQLALSTNPNNVPALSMLTPLLALNLSLYSWARGVNAEQEDVRYIRRLARHGRKLDNTCHSFTDVLGILADFEGSHDIARMWYEKSAALRTDPYWRLLMATSLGMSGNHDQGLFQMNEAIKEGANCWLVDFYMGRALANVGRYSEAIPYLEKAIKSRGLHPQLVQELRKCYLFQHLFPRAIYYNLLFAIIISSLSPKNAIIHAGLCVALFVSVIISFFQRLLWATLGGIPGLNNFIVRVARCGHLEQNLITTLISERHFEAALHVCRIAVHRFPKHPMLENNLATCLALCGQREAAIQVLERVYTDYPRFDFICRYNIELFKSDKPIRGVTFIDKTEVGPRVDCAGNRNGN